MTETHLVTDSWNNKDSRPQWDTSSFFDKWTFSIANELLRIGQSRPLQFDDMMELPYALSTDVTFQALQEKYQYANDFLFIPKLMNALNASNRRAILLNMIFTFMESTLRIASPVVLGILLRALLDLNSPIWYAYVIALVLGGMSILQTFIHGVSFYYSYRMGVGWKVSTIALIFEKLFHVKSEAFTSGTGKLVNLISNDVSRFEVWGVFAVFVWETFLEIIAIFVILYYFLGIYPVLAGVGTNFLLIPFQLYLAKQFAVQRTNTAQETDSRVRHTSEVIDGITSVKSFGWEKPFIGLIGSYRSHETLYIMKSQVLRAIFQGIYYSGATVATFATFSVYWAEGKEITIPIVFSTLSMMQVLKATMNRQWTQAIETGSEAAASCVRIDNFLNLPNASASDVPEEEYTAVPLDSIVEIKQCSFCYGEPTAEPVIADVSIEVKPGELVIVIGKVGCGKSSYLSALLGEMTLAASCKANAESSHGRRIHQSTRIAYCHQRPWILASSVRENIIFAGDHDSDHSVDEDMYRLAVESCCLVQDMVNWPAYDNTEIGERGVSVSGGQKARIALARAVYSNADLFVLDDPLSAVDAMVSKSLFFDCIVNTMKNRGKGVVLATHQLQYLQYADKIVVLNKLGKQVFYGKYEELQKRSFEFLGSMTASTLSFRSKLEGGTDEEPVTMVKASSRDGLSEAAEAPKYDPSMRIAREEETREQELQRQIIEKEDRVEGVTATSLYMKYAHAGGICRGVTALVMAVVSQVILMICDYWIRWWASDAFGSQRDVSYVWIYAILAGVCVCFGFVRALLWFQFTIQASCQLHDSCLQSVIQAPLAFFVANPTGRILNRFSRDMNIVDEQLPMTLFDFIQCTLLCLSAFLLVFITVPYMIILIPPLIYFFVKLRSKYVISSLELKRIEAMLRSPIYANFSAALEGLVTLRAYKLEKKMKSMFFRLLDDNCKAMFSFMMINRWFGLRMDLMCSVIVLLTAILSCALKGTVDVGLLGFALAYMLSVSALFQWTVRQSAEVESQMTSTERLSSYIDLPQEPYSNVSVSKAVSSSHPSIASRVTYAYKKLATEAVKAAIDPQTDTSAHGKVTKSNTNQFKYNSVILDDLTATYRLDLDPVLKGLTVQIPFGSKIGVCGRTGSGKSSFLLAMLRLNIIIKGDIRLDDKSLVHMPLEESRSLISLIPQEPHLFSGTLRFNLDPFNMHSDQEIWSALADAHIKDYIMRDPLGLLAVVEEGGKNFSQGQRQLLSLSRAVLRRCPIILMDEVSASIDYDTDELIQETIRTSPALKYSTIFTIAHRLRTISDSDLVLVIGAGELVEFGRPYDLLQKEVGQYKGLVEESNEFEDIYAAAKAKAQGAPTTLRTSSIHAADV